MNNRLPTFKNPYHSRATAVVALFFHFLVFMVLSPMLMKFFTMLIITMSAFGNPQGRGGWWVFIVQFRSSWVATSIFGVAVMAIFFKYIANIKPSLRWLLVCLSSFAINVLYQFYDGFVIDGWSVVTQGFCGVFMTLICLAILKYLDKIMFTPRKMGIKIVRD